MKKQNNVENFINNNISFKPDYSKIKDKVTTIIQESISQNDYHLRLNFQISIIFRFFSFNNNIIGIYNFMLYFKYVI
jgi:hypothetical protein